MICNQSREGSIPFSSTTINKMKEFKKKYKRNFWKSERQAEKTVIKDQLIEWDEEFQRVISLN